MIDEHGAVFAGHREVGFVQEGGDTKPADRSAPIEPAAREAMQFGIERPEQHIRDNPFIAVPLGISRLRSLQPSVSFAAADSPGRPKCPLYTESLTAGKRRHG